MKQFPKRFLALLLMIAMVFSLLPAIAFAEGGTETADLWAQIIAYENEHIRRTRSVDDTVSEADYAALSGQIAELVMASDDYKEGTCTYDGSNSMFFWENAEGEPQGYAPYLRAKIENGSNGVDPETVGETVTQSYAKKGGSPSGKNVYVIGPWYGSDSSFTDQYKTEGQSIAKATGGTYTLYSGSNATIANVAKAMEDGAVVIFDSHGVTDYDKQLSYTYPDDASSYVYDSVTGANTSYLTLTTGTGLTSADKARVTGTNGTYYHAWSFTSTDGDTVYCVDGTAIANHMTKNAPNSILWMAICLGMATTGISTPMHAKGVEVVYGYSQSVTFNGDYAYEEDFWTAMKNGDTVASAIAAMKSSNANWDPVYAKYSYYNTVAKARRYYVAFPVVVSSEDTHPGQRTSFSYGADTVQTVKSTWTLFSNYTVSAVSNNTAYGTVSVSGGTITCTPATGYYVASAAVTSGSGTCTVNGNIVSVDANSDCTVTVTFAAKESVTVSFNSGASTISGYSGDAVTLPAYSGTVPTGYTFAGWVEKEISAETTAKPTFYAAGSAYTPTTNVMLYALFTRVEGGSGTGEWTLVTDASSLSAGAQLLIASTKGFVAGDISNSVMGSVDATFSADKTTVTKPNDAVVLTLGGSPGAWTLANADGSLLGATAVKKLAWGSGTTTWSISISGSDATIQNTTSSRGRFLYNVGNPRFTTYTSTASSTMLLPQLYMLDGSAGTTYYGTNAVTCAHSNTTNVAAVAATCGTSGYTAGVYCNDCKQYISGHETIPATGNHTYDEYAQNDASTHLASCSVCGDIIEQAHEYSTSVSGDTTTYTCAKCGYSYSTTATRYTVTFSVPNGVAAVASLDSVDGSAITLPTAGEVSGYSFSGWVTSEINPESTSKPTILTGSYTPTANITLYALYSRTESTGSGSSDTFTLFTGSAIEDGDYVIVSSTTGLAMSSAVDGNWIREGTTYSGDSITSPTASDVWTISGSVLSAKDGSGNLYCSAVKRAALSATNSTAWTFTYNGSVWTIANDEVGQLSYNANNGSGGWRPYSGGFGSDTSFRLYKAGAGGTTTYYTTAPSTGSEPTHTAAHFEGQAATCTSEGVCAYWYCAECLNDTTGEHYGKAYSDEAMTTVIENTVLAALGHDFTVAPETTDADHYLAPTCTDSGLVYNKCSRCDTWDTVGTELPALGHEYKYNVVAPTCTEDGYTEVTCARCDYSDMTDIKKALGHSDYQYTDNGDGTHKVTCGVCSEVITASEAHVYVEGTCPCGATETPVVPKDENLKFLNVSLSLQECIQFTYMAKYTGVLNNYDSYYVAFSRNDFKDGLVENQDSGYKYSTRYHCFSYSVWSMQMNDEITATLYGVKNGVIYEGETVVKSVRDYVEEKFSAVNEATKLVYANMLQYGAMAQVNFAYDTENLVTTGLRDEITAYITTEAPATVNQTAATNNGLTAVKLAQNALGTQDAVKLQYVLNIGTSDVNSLYAVATWVNEKGETVEKRYEGSQFTKQGKYYIVLVDGLNAVNGKVPVSLTVYDASTNAAVSETFTCSIQSQVYARQTATNNTTAKVNALNLMNALMNYYNACEALFG